MIKKLTLMVFLFVALVSVGFAAEPLTLIPEGMTFVANINWGKLLTSEAMKKQFDDMLAKQSPEQKKSYEEFVTKTGMDPLKDLKEVTMFVDAKADEKTQKPRGGVLLTGTFDAAKIIKSIQENKDAAKDATIEKFEGLDCIKGKKDPDTLGLFLDANTILIGGTAVAKDVVAIKAGKGKAISGDAAFSGILGKADKAATLWGAAMIPASLKDQVRNNPQAAFLGFLNSVMFAFNYENDLTFSLIADVDKKENMEAVMTNLNGYLGILKVTGAQSPEAMEILNMIKVESADNTAKVTLNVTKAKLDEVKKKIEDKMKATQGGAAAPDKK
jgi:hypothetical protein